MLSGYSYPYFKYGYGYLNFIKSNIIYFHTYIIFSTFVALSCM